MLIRKRGETHQQFIVRLENENNRLLNIISKKAIEVNNFTTSTGLVPLTQYQDLEIKYNNLKERLMSYNLYTGD